MAGLSAINESRIMLPRIGKMRQPIQDNQAGGHPVGDRAGRIFAHEILGLRQDFIALFLRIAEPLFGQISDLGKFFCPF